MSSWPERRDDWDDQDAETIGREVCAIIAEVRKHKTALKLAMNAPVARIAVCTKHDLTLAENDLLSVTKAQSLEHEKAEEFSVRVE